MPYHYLDAARESDPHALPDVEVFDCCEACAPNLIHDRSPEYEAEGCSAPILAYFYWYASPGCLPECEAVGPFESEAAALAAAREAAGFAPCNGCACEHGTSIGFYCPLCRSDVTGSGGPAIIGHDPDECPDARRWGKR